MGRYVYVEDLQSALANVTLTGMGDSTAQALLLETEISRAETLAEAYCGQSFVPLTQHVETLSGDGTPQLRLPHTPLYDIQQIAVSMDTISLGYTIDGSYWRLERRTGRISLKSTYTASGAVSLAWTPSQCFPDGYNNITATYRTAFACVGDNAGTTALASYAGMSVARVSAIAGSLMAFDVPEAFALWKTATLLSARPPLQMLKDGVDDSSHWTMAADTSGAPRRLTCPVANYSATSVYTFVYVPLAVGRAVTEQAIAATLQHRSMRDVAGSAGGVRSVTAGPFREDYGTYQFQGQVDALTQIARDLLLPYKRGQVA